jgi:signal transduction histidine kinase
MGFRTWPVAALGLAGLLVLVAVSVLTASRRAQEIYTQVEQVNEHHREVDTRLRRLRSDVHLSSIFIRDYLLDVERSRAPEYRERLAEFRQSNMATLGELRTLARLTGGDEEPEMSSLQAKLEEYWQAFEPLFDWTTSEKITESSRFLRREVLPRREAVLGIAQEIEELNNDNLAAQRAEVTRRLASFRRDLHALLWQSLLLGVVVALIAVIRLRILERRAEEQRSIAEEAERQLRQLSQQVVATQEEERKKLSRELHDHVGQMLTALRMELGRIDRVRGASDKAVPAAVAECRQLVDNVVRTVRDLALGLRPSMLDDFGLQPALEWHIRDVSRRFGLTVDLVATGDLESLPDQHRTCVYRVVQEALTNVVRHSRAGRIQVAVIGASGRLDVSISDNGVGFNALSRSAGLGLRGIEERVRELGGTVSIQSAKGSGTTMKIVLPVPVLTDAPEVAVASLAR